MNYIEYLVFVSYILSLITLSFIPHLLYTGKALEDQLDAHEHAHGETESEEQLETETEEQLETETQEEQSETETQEEQSETQTQTQPQEDYTQTENITLRRRTVVFNEKDGTTTITTEYV